MDGWIQDLRYAVRSLRRTPAFTLGALVVLALGIGANTAIFSMVDALFLRALPFREPARLMWVWSTRVDRDKAFFSIPNFLDTRASSRSFAGLAAIANWSANLTGGEPERLQGVRISPDAFDLLGVRAALGRATSAADVRPGAARTIVLTDALWRRRFGGDRTIVGRTLFLNGDAYAVIGVLPRDFIFPGTMGVEFAVPLDVASDPRREERGSNFLRVFGRLAEGVAPGAAAAELAAITERLKRDFPVDDGKHAAPRVVPLQEEIVGGYRHALLLLLGAVGLVLLVACANLAHLMLVRASARRHEIAVRLAVGASRVRLARQLLVESATVAALGGGLGVALAGWGTDLLLRLAPSDLPRASEISLDSRVLAFTVVSCAAAALIFGLLPALGASRARLLEGLSGADRLVGSADRRTRNAFVIAQVALSLALLFTAGLFLRSMARLSSVDPGFDSNRLLTARLSLPAARYATSADVNAFVDRLTPRLAALPGARAVATVSILPLSGANTRADFYVADAPPATVDQVPAAQNRLVSAGYFATMGIPIVTGREFSASDRADTRPVAVIDRALARRFFPNRTPIGARLMISDAGPDPMRDVEIVGVAGDVKHFGLADPPSFTVYVPIAQVPQGTVSFLANNLSVAIRTQGAPLDLAPRLRDAVRALDAEVPASQIQPMDAWLAAAIAARRFSTRLLLGFAVAALLLAATGLYALISFGVGLRRREIGVRMALGARPSDVRGWVLGQGLTLALAGVLCGVPLALLGARLTASQLYEIGAGDPGTLLVAAAVLLAVAAIATWGPAGRAARVDPAVALRAD